MPVLSGLNATFRLDTKTLPQLEDDQVLIKVLYLSNDPAQRIWIDPQIEPDRLYTEPVEVGDTMRVYGAIAQILKSPSQDLLVGTLVSCTAGWYEYAVIPAKDCALLKSIDGLSPTHHMGVFGTPGVTAYYGMTDIVDAKPSDTVVISGAAGAVGSVAVQLAKNVLKCKKVIGIAGTDSKCRWVESLGADLCLNYKSTTFKEDLIKATHGFVEVYFDNTGGEILDLMLTRVKRDGRVAACGAIADYNATMPSGIKTWYHVIAMRLRICGFVVTDAIPSGRYSKITDELIRGFKEGKIRAAEHGQTIISANFEDIPKTWMMLFRGTGTGKLITELAKPDFTQ
ncbi:NAD(P)-binding protein [Microthyrium microscopicum]|uniref:NAD(P)-binding protein n=1 Tax=Microthyrium microscopicum TaxID=703497 RepID=A0A6A6U0H4_9PEZI|nr:NAD(P)-binding protein [Microthyrium microscopicum]